MAARLAACLEQGTSAGPGYEGDRKIVLARMLRRLPISSVLFGSSYPRTDTGSSRK
jgi:hypothetical protein